MAYSRKAGTWLAAIAIFRDEDCGVAASDSGYIRGIAVTPRLQTDHQQGENQNQYRAHPIATAFCRRAVA